MSADRRSDADGDRSSPTRPEPGAPRAYEFPAVAGDQPAERPARSSIADLPGRPLVSASVVVARRRRRRSRPT